MSFCSIFAGINFRKWVVSIANFLEIYVNEWSKRGKLQDIYTLNTIYCRKNCFKTYIYCIHALISVVFNCLFQHKSSNNKKGFSQVLIFANQSYQQYFAGVLISRIRDKITKFAKLVPAKISIGILLFAWMNGRFLKPKFFFRYCIKKASGLFSCS